MNDTNGDNTPSSEGGIRRVSADPLLTAEGIGGLGEEYVPPSKTKVHTTMGQQGVFDEDDQGGAPFVTSR